MIPGIDPRAMKVAMKKMGIKQQEIEASEVIIKTSGKDIIITNPQVMKVDMMGQESFQITGNIRENDTEPEIGDDDVSMVAEQAGVSRDKAKEALEEANGDLAEAIIRLKD